MRVLDLVRRIRDELSLATGERIFRASSLALTVEPEDDEFWRAGVRLLDSREAMLSPVNFRAPAGRTSTGLICL
jgi:hypothetical protein